MATYRTAAATFSVQQVGVHDTGSARDAAGAISGGYFGPGQIYYTQIAPAHATQGDQPPAPGALIQVSLARTGTVTVAVARLGAPFARSPTRSGTVAAALVKSGTYAKAASRTGTVAATLAYTRTLPRPLARTGTVAASVVRAATFGRALSRIATGFSYVLRDRVGVFKRTAARTGTVAAAVARNFATSRLLTRTGSVAAAVAKIATYTRRPARSGTVAAAVARILSTSRTAARTGTIAAALSKATSTYKKAAARTGTVAAVLVGIKSGPIIRLLSRTGTVAASVVRAGTFKRNPTRTGTVTPAVTRRVTLGRTLTRTGTITVVVVRQGTFIRTRSRTGTFAAQAVKLVFISGTVFFKFGPVGLSPPARVAAVIRLIDVQNYVGIFTFEAMLKTNDVTRPAQARLYSRTDASVVPGSTVQSTGLVPTRVRSGSLVLTGAKEYEVEFGGQGAGIYTIHSADVVPTNA
jgi:hypothetical protein